MSLFELLKSSGDNLDSVTLNAGHLVEFVNTFDKASSFIGSLFASPEQKDSFIKALLRCFLNEEYFATRSDDKIPILINTVKTLRLLLRESIAIRSAVDKVVVKNVAYLAGFTSLDVQWNPETNVQDRCVIVESMRCTYTLKCYLKSA